MSASILGPTEGNQQKKNDDKPLSGDLTASFLLGEWRVDPVSRCARNSDIEVKIDPRNMRVLQMLAQRPGQIVTQREIESVVWEGVVVTPDSVYQSIRQLRQGLGDTKPPALAKYIDTVPRKGYRLVAEVRGVDAAPSVSQGEIGGSAAPSRVYRVHGSWKFRLVVFVCTLVGGGLAFTKFFRSEFPVADVDAMQIDSQVTNDAQALRALAVMSLQDGRTKKTMELLERALRVQIGQTGERNQIVVDLMFDLANTQYWMNNDVAALKTARRARSILDEVAPQSSPERIVSLNIFAAILIGAGEYTEADESIGQSVDLAYKLYGVGHPSTFQPLSVLATLRHAQGFSAEAENISRKALAAAIGARGANDFRAAYEGAQLSMILTDLGRSAEAEREARISVEALQRSRSQDHPYLVSTKHVLAEALVKLGRLDEAQGLLREEIATLSRESAADWRIGRAAGVLAEVLLNRGELSGAERYLSLSHSKLAGARGWPAERELRKLPKLRAQLSALRSAGAADRIVLTSGATLDSNSSK